MKIKSFDLGRLVITPLAAGVGIFMLGHNPGTIEAQV
jgi:hypothetical protein